MTMPLYERIVNQCSINLEFKDPECATMFSIAKAINGMANALTNGGISKKYSNGTILLKVADVKLKDDYACLLISKIDTETADVVYSDIETLERREIKKEENEGNTICCHVLISLNPTTSANLTYKCVVERMYGIGILSDVAQFLQYVFREYASVHLNGNNFTPKLKLIGRESKSIRDVLSSSTLSKIKFSTRKEYCQGIDELNYVAVNEKAIIIKDKTMGEKAIEFLKDVIACNRANYSYASITITDDGQQKTNELELEQENIENGYVKKEIDDILGEAFFKPQKISNFSQKLEIAYEHVYDELINKMLPLL